MSSESKSPKAPTKKKKKALSNEQRGNEERDWEGWKGKERRRGNGEDGGDGEKRVGGGGIAHLPKRDTKCIRNNASQMSRLGICHSTCPYRYSTKGLEWPQGVCLLFARTIVACRVAWGVRRIPTTQLHFCKVCLEENQRCINNAQKATHWRVKKKKKWTAHQNNRTAVLFGAFPFFSKTERVLPPAESVPSARKGGVLRKILFWCVRKATQHKQTKFHNVSLPPEN